MSIAAPHAAHLAYLADAPRLGVAAGIALKAAVVLTKWTARSRSRRQLALLDDHLLRDIGLDRHTARTEAQRRFWQG
ncbi:Uncharacterized conserved protein YjiS, DUF1127 family [Roseivivax lentus]|uniref:Uncharacterized conserved protein YjiS, DUF1127 family n=1 Tax=Roseivivax lentus TaxID=633194 RepID=A0A1N7MZ45_9RHOB|nr:DUF1127 domain-containing protein [Roseivivax lentus]SIS91211.1 Uncharacterized conserved protein YjiS, DUF1127 family [Roseivivax lentus]